MTLSQIYAAMTPEDKMALKELQKEEEARTGKKVPLSELIDAVTPAVKGEAPQS